MKIKTTSWILGGAYLLCAVMFFRVISGFALAFAEQAIVLPPPTRTAFAIGPVGWLVLTATIGCIVVLKDLAVPGRLLNWVFSIVLILIVFFMTFAMLVPSIPVHAESAPTSPRAALAAALALSLFCGCQWRGASEPERWP